ncbi:hypothetical protein [Planctomicrobium piriforme]|uniref:hypothetical protein n=1 Tax=Planctomicrobium piriforme TaxID=1576369 RepID=UPI0011137B1A|nr:hypothetical protein [Planctomicrobium piriforme]
MQSRAQFDPPNFEEHLIERGKYVIRGRLAGGFIEATLHVKDRFGRLRPLPSAGVWNFAAKAFDETAIAILETWGRHQGVP